MPMGRPRTTRKDLPPGLYVDRWGTYFYRATRGGERRYVVIGKVSREEAIAAWVKITTVPAEAKAGTVAELIELYLEDLTGKAESTLVNYRFHCGKLRERWGARKYGVTADEAIRAGALRPLDVSTYLREARKAGKGAISANYAVAVLSAVFAHARECGLVEYNPCTGIRRNPQSPARTLPTTEQMAAALERASPRLRLMIEFARRTGWRQTDIRQFQVQQIGADRIALVQSKTKMRQEWEITPELRAILAAAETLPGRARSMFVFPMRDGRAVSARTFQSEWFRVSPGFQFRAIRKLAINQAISAGVNGTDFAGHHDPRTTRQHYDMTAKRVKPL
jgi:integrase